MRTENKIRCLVGILTLCVVGLAAQALALWRLDRQLSSIDQTDSIPASIQRRLDAQLDGRGQQTGSGAARAWGGSALAPDPFAGMQQLRQQMDSLFGSLPPFTAAGLPFPAANQAFGFSLPGPTLEMMETDSEYRVQIQTPPQHELSLNTELEADSLTLTGTLTRTLDTESNGFASSLVSNSQFSRRFDFSEPVDALGLVTEQTEQGLLLRVPKMRSS